ncbi:MAG: UvrD-helicase domain-containing protein [Deltaproteobacteria bacterium]|nr:UvrD-helicase domain-containing protein [Deltaproteobacteria bacterium]
MELNPQQQEAVEHGGGPLLVLAGAGSGKTRVLTSRIARLVVEQQVPASSILAVTFTNKAADEMRRRLESLIGPKARELALGTFHAICLRILRRHGEAVGLGPHFTVYDDDDQRALLKQCVELLGLPEKRFPISSLLDRISRAKDQCLDPQAFAAESHDFYLTRVAEVYALYQRRLLEVQAADYGDLIRLVVTLFERTPAILHAHRERWQHLLVDEYQDTNHAQYRLLKFLADGHRNLMVVGDPDQSIYAWRGADVSNILRFEQDFPGAKVVRLEQNYRSTKTILAAAQGVVEQNARRKPKTLWTDNADGDRIEAIVAATEREEANEILGRIRAFATTGKRFDQVAIFYRTNAQSRPFEEVFRAEGIPYRIYGGIRFYQRAEIKDIIAYLRLVADQRDDMAFLRIINTPTRGLGKGTIDKLVSFARSRNEGIFAALAHFVTSDHVRPTQAKQLSVFAVMITELAVTAHTRPLADLLHDVLERSGYIQALVDEGTIEAEGRIENINELVSAVEEFIVEEEGSTLQAFLDQVALISASDEVQGDQGAVTLMTLHLAKGLEFPFVAIVGMEEGLLPHARSLDNPDALEEERRLCYVGMTRAKERLVVGYARRRQIFGQTRYSVPSRFLDEIPVHLVSGMSLRGAERRSNLLETRDAGDRHVHAGLAMTTGDDFDQRSPDEQPLPFPIGARVHHPTFGRGIIRKCERSSTGHKVIVQFDNGHLKRLIAEYAGLIPL